ADLRRSQSLHVMLAHGHVPFAVCRILGDTRSSYTDSSLYGLESLDGRGEVAKGWGCLLRSEQHPPGRLPQQLPSALRILDRADAVPLADPLARQVRQAAGHGGTVPLRRPGAPLEAAVPPAHRVPDAVAIDEPALSGRVPDPMPPPDDLGGAVRSRLSG